MFEDSTACSLDFETFYDSKAKYSLTKMDPRRYCADERFDPYLVAICGDHIFDGHSDNDGNLVTQDVKPCVFRTLEDGRQLYIGRPEHFNHWNQLEGRIICCHNAGFDEVVTIECWKRGIIPVLKNVKWMCTADLSAYLMAPRNLKGAMKVLFGKEISK